MADSKKFKTLVFAAISMVVIVLSYNLLHEQVMPDAQAYLKRRLHYERVISNKDLSLHPARYWKEKK